MTVEVYIDAELWQRLVFAAHAEGQTQEEFCRDAISAAVGITEFYQPDKVRALFAERGE